VGGYLTGRGLGMSLVIRQWRVESYGNDSWVDNMNELLT